MNAQVHSVTRSSRAARTTAALLAGAVLGLTGCGGPAGADGPTDADADEFCEVIGGIDPGDPEGFVEALVETGTPEGISGEAREGYEILIDNADADEVSDAKQEKVNAFFAYVLETCGAFPGEEPTS